MAGKKGRSGGARKGAGGKPNQERQHLYALMDAAVSDADWKKIFARMKKIAIFSDDEKASVFASDYLTRNRFGLPISLPVPGVEGELISIVEIVKH